MTHTLLLGPHADRVRETLQRLRAQRYLPRLWERDASLWSADARVQTSIRDRLGWLRIAEVMARQAASLQAFAQEIRADGFQHALLLGMGGSGLFSEVCAKTLAEGGIGLTVLDSTDPSAIRQAQARCPLERLLVIVSSKSGSTSEITALSQYFYETLKQAGCNPGAQCIAITDAQTPLEAQAERLQYRRVFVHGPDTGSDVGGRFSALTYFGLVPAALMGVDLGRLLQRAHAMFGACGPAVPVDENPAAQLGAVLAALAQAGCDKMTLLCAPALASFGTWVEQLVAESAGKLGRGIAPIHGEPLREPATYGPDRVFVELQLASELDPALERHIRALEGVGHPIVRIHWQDRYDLGGEVAKWFVATAVLGGLLGIDPFDEPNVQESKDRTKALLEQYIREKRFKEEEPPLCTEGDVLVYGPAQDGATASLNRCLSAFFQRLRPRDYVAVLSFLPRTDTLDRTLHELRERLARRLGRATMIGFGPRYLHSTGQLYKGGPDGALFLQLTAEEAADLPIPGERFSFGALKLCQALGDFQAMRERGRRILRLHVRGDVERLMPRLADAIEEAAAPALRD